MLTWAERLILWNQYEILKSINAEDDYSVKEFEKNQEILSYGYELYYSELNSSIYSETISKEIGHEVQDILDVYRALHYACKKNGYTPKCHWAKFEGFDANNDDGYYSFAHFVRRTLGKWDELKDCPDNSHSTSSRPHYQAMVATWKRLGRKYDELTVEEIEEIAEAK